MHFKVGDKIKILEDCSGSKKGHIYTLIASSFGNLRAKHSNTNYGCSCPDNWILVNDIDVRKLNYEILNHNLTIANSTKSNKRNK